MWSLLKKELRIYFASPIAAVLATLFLFMTGFAFTAYLTQTSPTHLPEASLRSLTYFMAVILLFLCPLLTMRTLAEEKRSGTIGLLRTSPITETQIVLGKFLASWLFLALILALTVEFPIFLTLSGDPDPGPMILAYIGLGLFSASLIAAGIFCSSLTRHQAIAALLSFVLILTLWFLAEVGGEIGRELSLSHHLDSFAAGLLDWGDFSYFLFFTLFFILLTVGSIGAERSPRPGRIRFSLVTLAALLSMIFLYGWIERRQIRWDWTAQQQLSLSEQTLQVLKDLRQEVTIVASLRSTGDLDELFIRRKVDDVLKEYAARSRKISYELVDPESDPLHSSSPEGTIVFRSGKNRQDIYRSQLFDYARMTEEALPDFVGEGHFTNALLKVTREKSPVACLLQGHGERGLADSSPAGFSGTIEYLKNNNYEVRSVSLVTEQQIPDHCSLLIIAGANKRIPAPEVEALQKFASQRPILLLGEPLVDEGLDPLLKKWGLAWENRLILDSERHFLLGPSYPAPILAEHPITAPIRDLNPILATAKGLKIRASTGDLTLPLLTSSHPVTLGAVVHQGEKPAAVVIGDADFASNGLIQAPGNLDLFLNMVGWLVAEKGQVTIRPKASEFRNIVLTPGRARFIAVFSQAGFPLFILGSGLAYWWKRRRR